VSKDALDKPIKMPAKSFSGCGVGGAHTTLEDGVLTTRQIQNAIVGITTDTKDTHHHFEATETLLTSPSTCVIYIVAQQTWEAVPQTPAYPV
jgi:hypothetical protein